VHELQSSLLFPINGIQFSFVFDWLHFSSVTDCFLLGLISINPNLPLSPGPAFIETLKEAAHFGDPFSGARHRDRSALGADLSLFTACIHRVNVSLHKLPAFQEMLGVYRGLTPPAFARLSANAIDLRINAVRVWESGVQTIGRKAPIFVPTGSLALLHLREGMMRGGWKGGCSIGAFLLRVWANNIIVALFIMMSGNSCNAFNRSETGFKKRK